VPAPVAKTAAYDFRQASSLSSDQTRELGEYLGNLCRALSRTVPETTGLVAQFGVEALSAATYDEYLNGLPENPILALCEFVSNSPPLVWQMDAGVAFAVMDAMLGGKGSTPFVRDGELTALERALVTAIAGLFLTTWTHVWPALRSLAPRVTEVRQTAGRLGTESLQQSLVEAVIACEVGETTGVMRMGVPAVGLRQLLRQSAPSHASRLRKEMVTDQDLSRFSRTTVPVSVQLAHGVMTLEEVKGLKLGDIVLLDGAPREQVDIAIGGVKVLRGISGLANGRLAVRITGLRDG